MYQIYSKHINTNIAFPTWSPYIWFMQQAVLLIVTFYPKAPLRFSCIPSTVIVVDSIWQFRL